MQKATIGHVCPPLPTPPSFYQSNGQQPQTSYSITLGGLESACNGLMHRRQRLHYGVYTHLGWRLSLHLANGRKRRTQSRSMALPALAMAYCADDKGVHPPPPTLPSSSQSNVHTNVKGHDWVCTPISLWHRWPYPDLMVNRSKQHTPSRSKTLPVLTMAC